jgi:hypothetical protein
MRANQLRMTVKAEKHKIQRRLGVAHPNLGLLGRGLAILRLIPDKVFYMPKLLPQFFCRLHAVEVGQTQRLIDQRHLHVRRSEVFRRRRRNRGRLALLVRHDLAIGRRYGKQNDPCSKHNDTHPPHDPSVQAPPQTSPQKCVPQLRLRL